MSNGLPENNRERNAFHEAGHILAAWRVNPKAIGSVEIGHYTSRSRIFCMGFSSAQQTRVAVAGTLAEARGISNRKPEGNLGAVAGQILLHPDRREPNGAQWLDIPLAGGAAEKAAFSDDDFLLIHTDDHGRIERIAERLAEAVGIVEDHFHDGRITKLFRVLLNKGSLSGDEVRKLLE
jgi:hypothetical protein